jgi:serine/threonine-protein kinase
MAGPANGRGVADRNLLFGILALQMDFISRDSLIRAMHAWVLDKQKSLGEILTGQGDLAADSRDLLEALVRKHLDIHSNDAEKSLAAIEADGVVCQELKQIADPDIEATLASLKTSSGVDSGISGDGPTSIGGATSGASRFRILRSHARGGLGEVFVAYDEELRREVALKEIQPRHAGHGESRTRFLREAEITGALEHPGIVPVYGLGQYADGRPFYAMRLVRGETLQEAADRYYQTPERGFSFLWGSRRPVLEFRRLLERFLAVCETVSYAHSRGFLHRDLKPSNVMIGPFGETLVMDWGLAKMLDRPEGMAESEGQPLFPTSTGEPDLTQMGRALGTPAFMSPEQAAGRLDLLGPASDVYSLGATLYYLLTGAAPFAETEIGDVLNKVQRGDFIRPRRRNRKLDRALEAICVKAMELEPKDRYQTVGEMADDIEHWLADAPVSVYADAWVPRLWRWGYYHPFVSSLAFCLVLVLLAWIHYFFDLGQLLPTGGLLLRNLWLPIIFIFFFLVSSLIWLVYRLLGFRVGFWSKMLFILLFLLGPVLAFYVVQMLFRR